jgi:hypothetical protein
MLKCRVLFIEVLVLAALVLYLLFLLHGRHNTVTTVISPFGMRGGYAQTGDNIAFRTLYPGEGYTVTFQAPYPCQDSSGGDIKTLTVSGGETAYCRVTAPSGPASGVVFSYTVTQNDGYVVEPPKVHKGDGRQGVIEDSANPCKLCSPVIGGGDGDGGFAADSEMKLKELSSMGAVTEQISCNNGTAVVGDATVVQGKSLYWWANYNWTASNFVPVPQSSNTACSNGSSFSSTAAPSSCQAKDPGMYTYSVQLVNCANPGTGNLIVQAAASQGQAPK